MDDQPNKSKLWIYAAILTVFVASICIMAVEVTAGRIIARKMGASLYTWTSVIGVVLAGISLGSALGGHVADRFRPVRSLAVLFILSSASCVAIPVLNSWVHHWLMLWSLSWPAQVLWRVIIIFLLPATLLGMITPVTAKMALDVGWSKGRTLGDVYAWGNVGSILGVFLAGFWVIAWIGTMGVIWLVAGVLAVMAVLYALRDWWSYSWAGVLACLTLTGLGPWGWANSVGTALSLRENADPGVIYRDESQYSYIAVKEFPGIERRRVLALDVLVHSAIMMNDPNNLQYEYEQIYGAVTHRFWDNKEDLRTLTVGGGGYCLPRYLGHYWPKGYVEAVEIDPAVTEAAIKAFGLLRDSGIKIHHMDGRNLIERLASRKRAGQDVAEYDLIYGDVFNDCAVPFHLTTWEYNQRIRELLSPEGMYLINLIDIFQSGRFLGAMVNTFKRTFDHVYVVVGEAGPGTGPDDKDTFVVVGSMRPLDLADLGRRKSDKVRLAFRILNEQQMAQLADRSRQTVLMDNYAPVENLLAPVARRAGDFQRYLLVDQAGALLQTGQFQLAAAQFERALKVKFDDTRAHIGLGNALEKLGQLQQAMFHYQQVVWLTPDDPVGTWHFGRLLWLGGRPDEAEVMFRRGLKSNPDHVPLRRMLAQLLAAKNMWPEAKEQYTKLLARDAGQWSDHYALGIVRLAVKSEDKANEAFEKAIQLGADQGAHMKVGLFWVQQGRHDRAVAVFRAGTAAKPDDANLKNSLAWVLATCPDAKLRNPTEAITLAEQVKAKATEDNPQVLDTLSAAYAEAGRFEEAVTTAEQALAAARKLKAQKLVAGIRTRLELYRQKKPYHEPTKEKDRAANDK